jgi:hypothetical protein
MASAWLGALGLLLWAQSSWDRVWGWLARSSRMRCMECGSAKDTYKQAGLILGQVSWWPALVVGCCGGCWWLTRGCSPSTARVWVWLARSSIGVHWGTWSAAHGSAALAHDLHAHALIANRVPAPGPRDPGRPDQGARLAARRGGAGQDALQPRQEQRHDG